LKSKNNIFLLSLIILVGFLAACEKEAKPKLNVVAQVNLAQMTADDLDSAVPPTVSSEVRSALKRKLIEKWIENEIFYQAALKEGLALSENEIIQVKNYERSLVIDKYLDKYVNVNYKPLDQEIENYYNRHRPEFVWMKDHAHIIHLILDTDDQTLKDEISKSANLLEIIKTNFLDQQSSMERPIGDLGYVKLSDLPLKLAQTIKQIKTGAIRGPIRSEYGFHYIQVIDLQPAGAQQDLDVVKDEIIMRLKIERRLNEIGKLKQTLQPNFTIQTDLTKLDQQE